MSADPAPLPPVEALKDVYSHLVHIDGLVMNALAVCNGEAALRLCGARELAQEAFRKLEAVLAAIPLAAIPSPQTWQPQQEDQARVESLKAGAAPTGSTASDRGEKSPL